MAKTSWVFALVFLEYCKLQRVSPLLILLLITAPDGVVGNAHPTKKLKRLFGCGTAIVFSDRWCGGQCPPYEKTVFP